MASFGLKVIRGLFGVAEHVIPRFVGRVAFELFCRTPDKRALSEGEKRNVIRASAIPSAGRSRRMLLSSCAEPHF